MVEPAISPISMRRRLTNTIELMRITMYVFFPVGVFYYFNEPDLYENYVAEKRKKIHPPGNRPPAIN